MKEPAQSLVNWTSNLMPTVAKNVTPLHSEVPLLHISPSVVRVFTPRIPNYIKPGEDQTVPRICVSQYLSQCLAAARHSVFNIHEDGLILYSFVERDFLAANRRVTKEPMTGEGWIVPHRLSNWEMKPIPFGTIRLLETVGCLDGLKESKTLRLALRLNENIWWSRTTELLADKVYSFTVSSSGDEAVVEDLKQIELDEFQAAGLGYTVKY